MEDLDDRQRALVQQYSSGTLTRADFVRRSVQLGLSVGVAMSLLAACGGNDEQGAESAPPAEQEAGGTLRFAHRDPADPHLDPGAILSLQSILAGYAIYENLVRFIPAPPDASGVAPTELENSLAEVWEPSSDGLRYRFKLKEGVMFHGDYGELTSDDVKFSFERIAGLTGEELEYGYDWAALERVKKISKYEGEIVLKEPYAPLMGSTIPFLTGFIPSKRALEERGAEFPTNPIGTGPYEWVEWQPQQSVTLRRFTDWHGDAGPQWDEIQLLQTPDASARVVALQAGDVDAAQLEVGNVGQFADSDDFDVLKVVTAEQAYLGINLSQPKFEDINVRYAIRYGIDVPAIIEAVYGGEFLRATAPISPAMPVGYWPDAPVYERDVAKAQQYLADAGLDSLDVTLNVGPFDDLRLAAEVIQSNLAEAGINVTINATAERQAGDASARQQEMYLVHHTSNPPDPVWATQWWRCDGFDSYNWLYWCNPEYDRLDIAAAQEPDPAKRTELYIQSQMLWDEAAHTVWITWPSTILGTRKGLQVLWNFSTPSLPDIRTG